MRGPPSSRMTPNEREGEQEDDRRRRCDRGAQQRQRDGAKRLPARGAQDARCLLEARVELAPDATDDAQHDRVVVEDVRDAGWPRCCWSRRTPNGPRGPKQRQEGGRDHDRGQHEWNDRERREAGGGRESRSARRRTRRVAPATTVSSGRKRRLPESEPGHVEHEWPAPARRRWRGRSRRPVRREPAPRIDATGIDEEQRQEGERRGSQTNGHERARAPRAAATRPAACRQRSVEDDVRPLLDPAVAVGRDRGRVHGRCGWLTCAANSPKTAGSWASAVGREDEHVERDVGLERRARA